MTTLSFPSAQRMLLELLQANKKQGVASSLSPLREFMILFFSCSSHWKVVNWQKFKSIRTLVVCQFGLRPLYRYTKSADAIGPKVVIELQFLKSDLVFFYFLLPLFL